MKPSCRVQDELRMLPGFNASQMPQTSSLSQQRNYSSSSRPAGPSLYPPSHAPQRGSDPKQDSPFLPSDNEEDNSFIVADDDPADESAAAAVDDNADESAVEAAAEAARDLTTSCEEEAEQITAAGGESTASGEEAAEHGDIPQKLSAEEDLGMHAQSPERQSAGAMTKAAEAMTKAAEAMTEASKSQVQSVPAGSGIPDEYLRRVHMSTKTPLQTPSPTRTPHGTPPASISMPRQWTKTNSYPDGESASSSSCLCSSPTCVFFSQILLPRKSSLPYVSFTN